MNFQALPSETHGHNAGPRRIFCVCCVVASSFGLGAWSVHAMQNRTGLTLAADPVSKAEFERMKKEFDVKLDHEKQNRVFMIHEEEFNRKEASNKIHTLFEQRDAELDAQIKSLQGNDTEKDAQMKSLQGRVKSLKQEVSNIHTLFEQRDAQKDAQIKSLQDNDAEQDAQIKSLQRMGKGMENELDTVKSVIEKIIQRLNSTTSTKTTTRSTTTTTTTTTISWILAGAGKSCDDACALRGGCIRWQLSGTWTEERVRNIARIVGKSCSSYVVSSAEPSVAEPAIDMTNYECWYYNNRTLVGSCSQGVNRWFRRFCPCVK